VVLSASYGFFIISLGVSALRFAPPLYVLQNLSFFLGMVPCSQTFLEQTLDKKLMSNMRLKTSAHERQAGLVSSGEWSSGSALLEFYSSNII
jgi:hypothetical protein